MNFKHVTEPFSLLPHTFAKKFDGAFVSFDDDYEGMDELNYSFDGEMWFMDRVLADKFMPFVKRWFEDNLNNMEVGEASIADCLLYMHLEKGTMFVDTQLDQSSTLSDLFAKFNTVYQNPKMLYLGDAHLADNLVFGRDSVQDADSFLTLLYQQGALTDKVLFYGLDNVAESFDTDKKVVLTGTFSVPREQICRTLEDNGIKCGDKVGKNTWLWCGDKPSKNKLKEAENLGATVSNTLELMQHHLKQTNQPNLTIVTKRERKI